MGMFLGIFPNLTSFLENYKIVTFIPANKFGIIGITIKSRNILQQFIFPKTDFQKTTMSRGKPKYLHFSQKGQIHISSIAFPIFPH